MTTVNKYRAKTRVAAAKAVVDTWDAWSDNRVATDDPDFWTKYADQDEAQADSYRALNRVTDDRALSMALQDAEEFRRERAKTFRRHAEQVAEGGVR